MEVTLIDRDELTCADELIDGDDLTDGDEWTDGRLDGRID